MISDYTLTRLLIRSFFYSVLCIIGQIVTGMKHSIYVQHGAAVLFEEYMVSILFIEKNTIYPHNN